ncbi:hypothetical protein [Verrucosispora sioxanthis]|uniref:hypothetical protein n=1 Tax=Verrucosispora sioxanthis TaxID=2499994 RepID=UPI0035A174C6
MSSAVHAEYPSPTGPRPPAAGSRLPRWLIAATALWAVLLAGLTWMSSAEDPPTVREQRTLSQAGPVVDGAIGELVAAAGGGVPALSPPEVDRGCRISPFADGATLIPGRAGGRGAGPAGADRRAAARAVAGRCPAHPGGSAPTRRRGRVRHRDRAAGDRRPDQVPLAPLAGGTPVVETPEVYAYRRDGVAVLADLQPDRVVVSATTGCAG